MDFLLLVAGLFMHFLLLIFYAVPALTWWVTMYKTWKIKKQIKERGGDLSAFAKHFQ